MKPGEGFPKNGLFEIESEEKEAVKQTEAACAKALGQSECLHSKSLLRTSTHVLTKHGRQAAGGKIIKEA